MFYFRREFYIRKMGLDATDITSQLSTSLVDHRGRQGNAVVASESSLIATARFPRLRKGGMQKVYNPPTCCELLWRKPAFLPMGYQRLTHLVYL